MGVFAKRGILYVGVSFYLPDGSHVYSRISTGLQDTERNRKAAADKDRAIKYAGKHDSFNYLYFFPHGPHAEHFRKAQNTMTFRQLWADWQKTWDIRPGTHKARESAYRAHIGPRWADTAIADISAQAIAIWLLELKSQGMKATTVNGRRKVFCMALLHAKESGYIDKYPCEQKVAKRLKEERSEIEPFSLEEVRALLGYLAGHDPELHDLLTIWVNSGFRPGELCGLKWDDLDWMNGKIMVRRTVHDNRTEGEPKTGPRVIDLTAPAAEALRRQKARTLAIGDYVFYSTQARRTTHITQTLNKKLRHACLMAGVRPRPCKQVRHTFATLALSAGENIGWVSMMLGHASSRITWDTYHRFIPNCTRADGSAMQRIMEDAKNENHAKAI